MYVIKLWNKYGKNVPKARKDLATGRRYNDETVKSGTPEIIPGVPLNVSVGYMRKSRRSEMRVDIPQSSLRTSNILDRRNVTDLHGMPYSHSENK